MAARVDVQLKNLVGSRVTIADSTGILGEGVLRRRGGAAFGIDGQVEFCVDAVRSIKDGYITFVDAAPMPKFDATVEMAWLGDREYVGDVVVVETVGHEAKVILGRGPRVCICGKESDDVSTISTNGGGALHMCCCGRAWATTANGQDVPLYDFHKDERLS